MNFVPHHETNYIKILNYDIKSVFNINLLIKVELNTYVH